MRLGTKAQGKREWLRLPCNRAGKGKHITDLHPPHQDGITLRNGPAPKRAESCATDTLTPAPSAARNAAG